MTNPIDDILTTCKQLICAIEDGKRCADLTDVQEQFSAAVELAMSEYNAGRIKVQLAALPKVMYIFATKELPKLCTGNEESVKKAYSQLKLFLTTMERILKPELTDS